MSFLLSKITKSALLPLNFFKMIQIMCLNNFVELKGNRINWLMLCISKLWLFSIEQITWNKLWNLSNQQVKSMKGYTSGQHTYGVQRAQYNIVTHGKLEFFSRSLLVV